MNIEVATPTESTTKNKGDLLENLATDFLRTQGFEVEQELRVTGAELDLLCKHKVNKKTVYVECKAHRDTLSANVLKQLLGTIVARKYQEGWLISTGSLGKDAKGFQHEWENQPTEDTQKLTIYTPERVIRALIDSKVIKKAPHDKALSLLKNEDYLGNWTLLITPFGRHWAISCLVGGVPEGVIIYSAATGDLVTDQKLLRNIAKTDTSIKELDFEYVAKIKGKIDDIVPEKVIEVQHGDSWSDYRPARPQDFVGRQEVQKRVIRFFEDIRAQKTRTRVFAITGDSGMGKSSLIAKLRARVQNQRYKKKYFIYAVDVRAATNASYILSALLECLREAASREFGKIESPTLKITNSTEPLESPTIKAYLESLDKNNQVVCLVFDQFEELYSKPLLFNVFDTARRLFLSVTSAQSNLVLGFAWKSDSTVHQDHPAYFMWHSLSDHRFEIELKRFRHDEASAAITLFEKELGQKLLSSLRRQLLENTQGYPWWLKKLSIHVYEQIQLGMSQSELLDKALDIESLFKRDLQKLTKEENTCLKLIAENAPADWFEVLEFSGDEVLRSLIHKRLIIKSGEKLTVYWDIFREYVISQKVPSIPLTYLPSYQSLNTVLMLAQQLSKESPISYSELSKIANISEKTVANVIHDLQMFGVANAEHSKAVLNERVEDASAKKVLKRLRFTLSHHAVTMSLRELESGTIITQTEMIDILKGINPTAQHGEKTWEAYADRLCQWLTATGFLVPEKEGWRVEDQGNINIEFTKISVGYYKGVHIFIGDAPPAKTVQGLNWLMKNPDKSWEDFTKAGLRNAALALRNLGIITNKNGIYVLTKEYKGKQKTALEIVWEATPKHEILQKTKDFLKKYPTCSGDELGSFLNNEYERNWSPSSIRRVGNSLRQWAHWLIKGETTNTIPKPIGPRSKENINQKELFDFE